MSKKILQDYGYREFRQSVINGNEHVLDEEARKFLDSLLQTAEERTEEIEKGSMVWRAQRGCDWRGGDDPNSYAICHPEERMMPDARHVGPGRANVAGKPVFYGSTDRNTAVKETRPWIGCLVSVARFETSISLKLVNLVDAFQGRMRTFAHLMQKYHGSLTDEKAEEFAWHTIGEAFCEPVSLNDDPKAYLPTQIIAELFKSAGYDGIAYRCSVDGLPPQRIESDHGNLNTAIFDPSVLRMVDGDVVHVTKVDVTLEEGPHY